MKWLFFNINIFFAVLLTVGVAVAVGFVVIQK